MRAVTYIPLSRLKMMHCWRSGQEKNQNSRPGPYREAGRGTEVSHPSLQSRLMKGFLHLGWHVLGGLDRLIGERSNIPQLESGQDSQRHVCPAAAGNLDYLIELFGTGAYGCGVI